MPEPSARKLTKRVVDALEGEQLVWDTVVRRLAVRCRRQAGGGAGAKSYLVKYRVGRGRAARQRWYRIGTHGEPGPDGEPLGPEAARTEAQRILGLVAQGLDPAGDRYASDTRPTLEVFWRRYLREYAIPRKKPRTIVEERHLARKHILPALGKKRLTSITRADIAALHTSRHHQPGGANRMLALLAHVLEKAIEWGALPDGARNPCRYVKPFRVHGRQRYLSEQELARLGASIAQSEAEGHAPAGSLAAIRLLIFTGMRKTEVLELRWSSVDFDRGYLRLPDSKTGPQGLPLNAPARALLAALPRVDGCPWVFPGERRPDGGWEPIKSIEGTWRTVRARAGLQDLHLHDLRHSFASVGAGAGHSLKIIGGLLGHRRSSTTDRYAHLSDDPLRVASEAIAERIEGAMKAGASAAT